MSLPVPECGEEMMGYQTDHNLVLSDEGIQNMLDAPVAESEPFIEDDGPEEVFEE